MINKQHWSVKQFRKLRPSLGQYTNQTITEMIERTEGMENSDLFLVEMATFFSPDPIGLAHIYKRGPYANPEGHKDRLAGAEERGWLAKMGDGGYTYTDKGAKFYERFSQAYKKRLSEVESIPDAELERIQELLAAVVQRAGKNPDVQNKPALELAQKESVDADAATIQKVQLFCEQLLSYRDDAHVASWSPHKLEGITWETFSDVWEGKVTNAAEMAERRPFRRYEQEDYAAAFEELAGRGWLKEKKGNYSITEEGRRIREHAEENTNQYYDSAWAVLNDGEAEELKMLFQKLLDNHEPERVPA